MRSNFSDKLLGLHYLCYSSPENPRQTSEAQARAQCSRVGGQEYSAAPRGNSAHSTLCPRLCWCAHLQAVCQPRSTPKSGRPDCVLRGDGPPTLLAFRSPPQSQNRPRSGQPQFPAGTEGMGTGDSGRLQQGAETSGVPGTLQLLGKRQRRTQRVPARALEADSRAGTQHAGQQTQWPRLPAPVQCPGQSP